MKQLDCLEHFHFGEGKVTVHTGSVDGVPALVFTHAKIGGVPGEVAPVEEPSAKDPAVLLKSVVLTFNSTAQRDAVKAAFSVS